MPRRVWYLVTNSLVVAWLLAALVLVVAHQWLPVSRWLMVHVLVLGAVSTAILIWSQHFADTLLRRQAVGGRMWLGIRLAVFTLGALSVIVGMVWAAPAAVLAGGIVVAAVGIAHAVTLGLQMRRALPSRFRPLVRYYILAGGALLVGVGMGVLMTRAGPGPELHGRLYVAHVGMNILGWIGLTVIGTVLLLWPTILHVRVQPTLDAVARRVLPILAGSLLVLLISTLADVRALTALGAAGYLAGVVLVAIEGVKQARSAPPSTYAGWSMGLALLWLIGCVGVFGALVATAPTWADAAGRVDGIVPAFAVGFVAQIVVGALSYLLPVVAGGSPDGGKVAARQLDRAGLARVIVLNAGLVIALLPAPPGVVLVVSAVIAAVFASFLALAVRAVVLASRLRRSESPGTTRQEAGESAPQARTRSGLVAAATGILVMAVAVGVALNPSSAGIRLASAPSEHATGHTTTVTVTMKDIRFHPDQVTVPAGDRLVIKLINRDRTDHDLVLANGANSGIVVPGAKATLDAGVIGSDLDGWCSVAGHRLLGMTFAVHVTSGDAASSPGDAGSTYHTHHSTDASAPSAASDIDLAKKPPASFTARSAVLPPTPAGTVHNLTFRVKNVTRTVAPGVKQTLWTFNGTAPGPTLHGTVGDVFHITLINDGTIGHSIDFHAGAVAPDAPMRTIAPGKSLVYTFTAQRSGIWLYHCATAPMSLHIANGMYGAVVIDPPGLDPVAQQYVMIQGEYYLGPQGESADAAKVPTEHPDLVVFNGYANQYVYRPIPVKTGERIRIWVLDAGPNVASSFHVIGGQFDTVFKEGDYRLKNGGSTGTGGSQALGLEPAQGGFVELSFAEAGTYPFVSHIMSDAEKGAKGTFRVTG